MDAQIDLSLRMFLAVFPRDRSHLVVCQGIVDLCFVAKDSIGMRINCVQNMSSGRLNDLPERRMIMNQTDTDLMNVCK